MERQEKFRSEKRIREIVLGINDDGETGFFEIYDTKTGGQQYYSSGSLWFNGDKLVDYDGVFELPNIVKEKLEEWVYKTDLI